MDSSVRCSEPTASVTALSRRSCARCLAKSRSWRTSCQLDHPSAVADTARHRDEGAEQVPWRPDPVAEPHVRAIMVGAGAYCL